jgi:sugar/nucleoside kinase (ribokinase family)
MSCAGFPVAAIDTTAAGDSFMATLLSQCLALDLDNLQPDQMSGMLRYACAAGALATTAKGAMTSLPDNAAIAKLLGG